MTDARLQRAIAELCWTAEDPARFVAACVDAGVDPREAPKLAIYRQLVRGNLRAVAEQMMPRAREILGASFDHAIERFMAERGPRTHYLRDVPHELLEFARPLWTDPPWAADLAAWELAHYAVSAAPKSERGAVAELALDKPVRFEDAVRLLRAKWTVHEETPAERATCLLVYRDAELEIRALELSDLAARVTERLLRGETLGAATQGACADANVALDPEVLGSIAQLLADFAERGLLLGGEDAIPDRA